MTPRFGILGALEAYDGDRQLQLGPFKQRMVLGLLLCQANKIVSVATLTDTLWDDDPPRTAHKNLQVYVSELRKMLRTPLAGPGAAGARLLHSPPGYVLQIGPDQLDALRFQELARTGRQAGRGGDHAGAAELLGAAVRMWRGAALPDLVSAPSIAAATEQLHEQYLVAYEDWAEAKLALGHHTDVVDDVDELARDHPFRERLRHAQMLALYRSGRHTEALAQFDTLRRQLARDLGLGPSPVLARLYEAMLSGDRSLTHDAPGGASVSSVRTTPAEPSLPRHVAAFTGRTPQVAALLDVLVPAGPGDVVTISGPAGVGKTALAVHCAFQLGERFPAGRVLVCMRAPDGRPRPVLDLLGDLLRGTGLIGALPGSLEDRAALLRESTAGRDMLFVLDDAVTEAQVRLILATVGDGVVVVTSRRHLGGLEASAYLMLEPMTEAEGIELLARLIGRERVAAEPETARRLVAACCGLPLAVRIVGAKLAGLRHLTLHRYVERLGDEQRLLDELVAGDLEVRSRLAVWYDDLPPEDRATLRCLASLESPTFGVSEVAASLGTDSARAEAGIERLIEASLVQAWAPEVEAHAEAYPESYTLPSLIGAYVRNRAVEPAS